MQGLSDAFQVLMPEMAECDSTQDISSFKERVLGQTCS